MLFRSYMFSLENLAWRTSSRPGFTYDELPDCEKGPNGGRVMWFPPYDIKFSETSSANFNGQTFLGRPEPIYTYNNTKRSGSLNFKIVVDHPSVLNLIVNKELQNQSNSTVTSVVESFFAGCKKYDIYELAQKFSSLSLGTIDEVYQQVLESLDTSESDKVDALTQIPKGDNSGPKELPNLSSYVGNALYFNADLNVNNNYDQSYTNIYNNLLPNISSGTYPTQPDSIKIGRAHV